MDTNISKAAKTFGILSDWSVAHKLDPTGQGLPNWAPTGWGLTAWPLLAEVVPNWAPLAESSLTGPHWLRSPPSQAPLAQASGGNIVQKIDGQLAGCSHQNFDILVISSCCT